MPHVGLELIRDIVTTSSCKFHVRAVKWIVLHRIVNGLANLLRQSPFDSCLILQLSLLQDRHITTMNEFKVLHLIMILPVAVEADLTSAVP